MDWHERIVIDPAVLTGKPVIKGTRLAADRQCILYINDY